MKLSSNPLLIAATLSAAVFLGACSKPDSAPANPQPAGQTNVASSPAASAIDAVKPGFIRVHYHREGGDYEGWGVYAWKGSAQAAPAWPANIAFSGTDDFGVYLDLPFDPNVVVMDFLITDGKQKKDCANDQSVTFHPDLAQKGQDVWIKSGDCKVFDEKP